MNVGIEVFLILISIYHKVRLGFMGIILKVHEPKSWIWSSCVSSLNGNSSRHMPIHPGVSLKTKDVNLVVVLQEKTVITDCKI